MKMKHISSTVTGTITSRVRNWHSNIIDVERISLSKCSIGDLVYIEGDLVDGKPTTIYGPHKVHDVEKQILINRRGRTFYERSPVFRKCTD